MFSTHQGGEPTWCLVLGGVGRTQELLPRLETLDLTFSPSRAPWGPMVCSLAGLRACSCPCCLALVCTLASIPAWHPCLAAGAEVLLPLPHPVLLPYNWSLKMRPSPLTKPVLQSLAGLSQVEGCHTRPQHPAVSFMKSAT